MSNSNKNVLERDWPEAKQFGKSIRREFSIFVSGMLLCLMLITGYITTRQYAITVTRNIVDKLLVQARSYSGPAGKLIISTNGPDALLLNNIGKKLTADNSDVYWVGITDSENRFLAHTDIRQVVAAAEMPTISGSQYHDLLREGEAFELRGDTIFISVPIRENNLLVGTLGVASSVQQIAQAQRVSIITLASITAIIILLGIPLTTIVLHRKLRPVSVITDHLKRINFDDLTLDIPITSKNEFGYLAETLKVMGAKLNISQREAIEKERIARELEIAHEIQANILPHIYPKEPSFEFFGTYKSAREVGGDYYDFIDCGNNCLGFLVADVSGKSLPGMLMMLLTRDIVRRHSRTIAEPAKLLCEVNRELLANIKKGMFVTMFFGIIDATTGRFSFASAGHNPLVRMSTSGGRSELIKTKGYPLGLLPPDQFDERIEHGDITLADGDWLIQYTDGINEAQNEGGEEFGMDRLVELLESYRGCDPATLVEKAIADHNAFVGDAPQFDDITLLAMKWTGITADKRNNVHIEELQVG